MYDLPRDENWAWKAICRLKPLSIAPGEEEVLWDEEGKGWIFNAISAVNSKKARVRLDVYADGIVEVDTTPEELYNMGFLGVGNGQFLVSRYDDVNNYYVVQYVPHTFGVPFRGRNRCAIINDTDSDIIVYFFSAWLIIM